MIKHYEDTTKIKALAALIAEITEADQQDENLCFSVESFDAVDEINLLINQEVFEVLGCDPDDNLREHLIVLLDDNDDFRRFILENFECKSTAAVMDEIIFRDNDGEFSVIYQGDNEMMDHWCDDILKHDMASLDFDELHKALDLADDYCVDSVKAYISLFGSDCLDEFQDRYQGSYSSEEDFAEEYAEQCGYLNEIPSFLRNHIDFEDVWRCELSHDFSEEDGFYFSSY